MSEQLDPMKLDLIGVLSGRDYPELEVPVYFNETLGFEIQRIRESLVGLELSNKEDEYAKANAELESLVKKTEDERFIVTLKAVPESVYRDILQKVQKEFPEETDFLGKPKPNPEGDAFFTRKLWEIYILSVTAPDGAKTGVGPKEIEAIVSQAPALAQEAITRGISELRTSSRAGFEYAVKEVDFLSQASPEG